MGKYIDPKKQTKEQFLEEYGKKVSEKDMVNSEFDQNNLICVHIDNLFFTAALICYDKEELDYIKKSIKDEVRPIKFFKVKRKHLIEFLN